MHTNGFIESNFKTILSFISFMTTMAVPYRRWNKFQIYLQRHLSLILSQPPEFRTLLLYVIFTHKMVYYQLKSWGTLKFTLLIIIYDAKSYKWGNIQSLRLYCSWNVTRLYFCVIFSHSQTTSRYVSVLTLLYITTNINITRMLHCLNMYIQWNLRRLLHHATIIVTAPKYVFQNP
jgi:hypothetical protein